MTFKIATWNLVLGIFLSSLSLPVLANPIDASQTTTTSPSIVLDASQDIFFDEFATNTFALQTLQAKNKFAHGDLIIGGALQTDLQTWHGNPIFTSALNIYNHGGGLYLTQATVYAMANIHYWITGLISFADSHAGTGGADGNYYYFPNAFILFGNQNSFPVYATLGINTIPFGVFTGSGPWDTPLTASYFYPSQAPQLSLAYTNSAWNIAVTEFRDETNYLYHSVENISYTKTIDVFSYTLGAGYLNSLQTNAAGRPWTTQARRSSSIAPNLGGIVDLNGSAQYRKVGMAIEYVEGSKKVIVNQNKPRAYSVEVTYTPNIVGADTSFGLTYSKALSLKFVPTALAGQDAIPLALPGISNSWALGVSRQVMIKNVVLGFELEKATTYTEKNTYTGTMDLMLYL